MRREVWCEPVLGRNREKLVEICQSRILSGRQKSFVYLLATTPLLNAITTRIIDGKRVRGCCSLQVYLFDQLVRKILDEEKIEGRFIEDATKYFLIERVVGALIKQEALDYVRDIALMPGCVQSIGNLIGELKRAGKTPSEFRHFVEQTGGNHRDQDLVKIFESYQKGLDNQQLLDSDDCYLQAKNLLVNKRLPVWLQQVEAFYVDGFFDFTPIQGQLIALLADYVPDVIVNMTFDPRNREAFGPTPDTLKFFERLKFTTQIYPTETASRNPKLASLAVNLFNPASTPSLVSDPVPVAIVSAPDSSCEIREVAKQAKRLILEQGYKPSDIALVMRELSIYIRTVQRVFTDEGIPITPNIREPLSRNPAVRTALKVLECRVNLDSVESFVPLLKNDYLAPFDQIDRDAAENAVIAIGVELNTHDWLKRAKRVLGMKQDGILPTGRNQHDPENAALEINRTKLAIGELEGAISALTTLQQIIGKIPEQGSFLEFSSALRACLNELGVLDQIKNRLPAALGDEANLTRAARDLRALEQMIKALEDISKLQEGVSDFITSSEIIEVSEFRGLFDHLLGRTEVLISEGDPNGVACFDVTQARGLPFRAVFIVGLIDGSFPQRPASDWLYSHAERKRLGDAGVYLKDLSPLISHRNEEHFFYESICLATEYLYLSFPRTIPQGEEAIASSFIDAVRDLIRLEDGSRLPIQLVGGATPDFRRLSSRSESAQILITNLWQDSEEAPILLSLYNYALARKLLPPALFPRLRIEEERLGKRFGRFDGVIEDVLLQAQFQKQFGPDKSYTLTQFNNYAACPFQFFCKRVLKLRPRPEASIDLMAIDRGKLLHDILYQFLVKYVDRPLSRNGKEIYVQEIKAVANEVFARYEKIALPLHSQIWELEKLEITETLVSFLEHEIEYQERVAPFGVQPHWLEISFGLTKEPGLLIFERDKDLIKIRGRIDRVDRSRDGKFIVYDYKSSSIHDMKQMRAGTDLQIPVYMLALRRLLLEEGEEVVGGGYYSLKDGSRNKGVYIDEFSSHAGVSKRCESSISLDEWEELQTVTEDRLWNYADGFRNGDFRVAPKLPIFCPRCDYRTVCRYNKHRIQNKLLR